MLDLESGKVKDFVRFDVGNLVMVTGGHNNGRVGTIVHREKHKVRCGGGQGGAGGSEWGRHKVLVGGWAGGSIVHREKHKVDELVEWERVYRAQVACSCGWVGVALCTGSSARCG